MLFKLITRTFLDAALRELRRIPSVFDAFSITVVCYNDDLILFANNERQINILKCRLNKDLVLKDLSGPPHPWELRHVGATTMYT